ncbi:density-regulated protein-like [Tropilaelaps mercedesae]|uniref:Density-regulated protein n=1 Tax=Tropilaelaps mercedesae TaxID=418985 RepID=A0A1V9XZ39_9ACAR|nr:density-regulated protein-like [Tropilaelaps mercedesae]
MPIEYCEYYSNASKCREWLQKHLPEEFEKRLKLTEGAAGADGQAQAGESGTRRSAPGGSSRAGDATEGAGGDEEKKRQKRGGKGVIKAKRKVEKERHIQLSRQARGKKKSVTVIQGLATFDIDLKEASKLFGHKFACGSSVTGEDEIVIQGDVKDDLYDLILEKWPEIDEDAVEDLGDVKAR